MACGMRRVVLVLLVSGSRWILLNPGIQQLAWIFRLAQPVP